MDKRLKQAVKGIQGQKWLDQIDNPLQRAIANAYKAGGETGQKIKNVLHGTWLEHPLHPVLTDLPIGSWTAALVLDVFGRDNVDKKLATGADAAIAVGLAGAAGSAVTGLTDWQHVDGPARRIGLMHGLLNISAFAFYTISLLLRLSGSRSSGRTMSLLGYTTATAAAYLGGELVYGQKIGVDHANRKQLKPEFTAVLPEADFPDSQPKQVDVDGVKVLLVRRGQQVYAIGNVCSHLSCSLSGGRLLSDNSIICPCHGSRFSLENGQVLDGPAVYPETQFEARIRDGKVEVRGIEA